MNCDHCKKEVEVGMTVFSLELRRTLYFCDLKCLDGMIEKAKEDYKSSKYENIFIMSILRGRQMKSNIDK